MTATLANTRLQVQPHERSPLPKHLRQAAHFLPTKLWVILNNDHCLKPLSLQIICYLTTDNKLYHEVQVDTHFFALCMHVGSSMPGLKESQDSH